jgi:hypothetical protein
MKLAGTGLRAALLAFTNFRSFGSRWLKDRAIDGLAFETF